MDINEEEYRQVINLLLEDHNKERVMRGLNPLQLNAELCKPAKWMAEDMAMKGYMAHTDSSGRNVSKRISDECSYPCNFVGENVAVGYMPKGIVKGWMGSEGHKRNIIKPEYTHIGIGYYYKSFATEKQDTDSFDYCDYFCCVFGKK